MGYEVNKIITTDTDDVIEATGNSVLLMSSLLYDDILNKNTEKYEKDIVMLNNSISWLISILKTKYDEVNYKIDIPMITSDSDLRCSFCGKKSSEVKSLIKGLGNNYICNECAGLCMEIIEDEK